jgi:hypothetical protein
MSKKPISLAEPGWQNRLAKTPSTPEPAPKPMSTMVDQRTIEAIVAVIEGIETAHPLNFSAVMRGIGKGSLNFRSLFDPTALRVSSQTLDALVALFDCQTPEEFFALAPGTSPNLGELIRTKGLGQYRARRR